MMTHGIIPNSNWIDETLKDWAPQHYANVTVSGGSEKLRALLSLGARYQDGFVRQGSGKYYQYDVRSNIDFNPNKYILFSVDINGRQDRPDFSIADAGRIFHQTVTAPPYRRAYWPDGTLGQAIDSSGKSGSPVAIGTPVGGYNSGENYVINGTGKLNIKLPWVEGLSFTVTGTIDRVFNYGKYWTIPVGYNQWDGVSTTDPVFNPIYTGR